MATEKQQKATTFLEGVLQYVPEAQRAQAAELFQTLGNVEQAAEYVAGHILRQEDYSKVMNESQEQLRQKQTELDGLLSNLRDTREEQQAWWTTNRAALEEWKTLKQRSPANPNPAHPNPTPGQPTASLSREDVDALVNERVQQLSSEAINVIETYNALSLEHYKTFGEALTREDFERIRKHPSIQETGLVGAWKATYKDRFDAKAEEARKTEQEKYREEGRQEMRNEFSRQSGPPYVVPGLQPAPIEVLAGSDTALTEAQAAMSPAALAQEYQAKVAQTSPDDAGWFGG